jgi:hypothetical protein
VNALTVVPAAAHRYRPWAGVSFGDVIAAVVVVIAVVDPAVGAMSAAPHVAATYASGSRGVGRS